MTARMLGVVGFLSLVLRVAAAGQDTHRLTIPELVSRHGAEPLSLGRARELLAEDFDDLVSKSDLIIEGTVEKIVAYLSEDQRDLFTDYFLSPRRVVMGSAIAASSVPGAVPPVIIERWGGETVIAGVRVTVEDDNFRGFRVGEDLLLVLVHNRADGKYHLAGDTGGAFSVVGGQIQPIVNHPKCERFVGMTVEQLESEVRRLRQ